MDGDRFTERMEVRLTKMQWQRFKKLVDTCDVPMSELVRKAIDDLIDQVEGQLNAEAK